MFSAKEIFDLAIKIEENGARFYRNALPTVSDTPLHTLFEWLADEEIKHKEWFIGHRNQVPPGDLESSLQEAQSTLLAGIMGNQVFSLDEADLTSFHRVGDLLALAQEFEKDTILFFEMLRGLVSDPETLKRLDAIIEEEQHHIQLLKEYEEK